MQNRHYPPVSRVFVSPMRRCVETANLLYPGVPQTIIGSFRECDFGDFENKNYAELNGRADYQAWIDSGGELPFPHGESRAQFAARCVTAFEQIRQQDEDCAVVAHGGTLMAIMEKFGLMNPIFSRVSCYGHFGSNAADMPWERTDLQLSV